MSLKIDLPSSKLRWQWKITIFDRRYIFKGFLLSNVMLVLGGVNQKGKVSGGCSGSTPKKSTDEGNESHLKHAGMIQILKGIVLLLMLHWNPGGFQPKRNGKNPVSSIRALWVPQNGGHNFHPVSKVTNHKSQRFGSLWKNLDMEMCLSTPRPFFNNDP